MFINKNSRPYKAGSVIADGLCETGNCLYLLDNRLQFLSGIAEKVNAEIVLVSNILREKRNEK